MGPGRTHISWQPAPFNGTPAAATVVCGVFGRVRAVAAAEPLAQVIVAMLGGAFDDPSADLRTAMMGVAPAAGTQTAALLMVGSQQLAPTPLSPAIGASWGRAAMQYA